MKTNTLSIKNLFVSVDGNQILSGVHLTIKSGEVHAIMGPNGSGKSTLAHTLMGHPQYLPETKSGNTSQVLLNSFDILGLPPDERAKKGLFLAFQSPVAVEGVSVLNLLRSAYQSIYPSKESSGNNSPHNPVLKRRWASSDMSLPEFIRNLKTLCTSLRIDDRFLERSIHDGFSGGEKKKAEMLQALVLKPKFALFDEIDTGLDVDALKVVAEGIGMLKENKTGIIIITHYHRILRYITPDAVHVMKNGRIVLSGTDELAKRIEEKGYSHLH